MYLPDQYVINSSLHTEAHRVGNTVTTTGRVSHCNFVLKLGVSYTNQYIDSSNQSRNSLTDICVCATPWSFIFSGLCSKGCAASDFYRVMWSTQSVLLSRFFHLFYFCLVLYGAWVHLLSPSTSDVVKFCWMALPFCIAGPCFWQDLQCSVLTSTMHISQPGAKLCSVDTEMSEPLAVQ